MLHAVLHFLAANWFGLVFALLILHAASVALAILSERREPAATVAWLMTVIFLPVIGVALYYAMARTRFRRRFRQRTKANEQADEALSMYVQQRLSDFDETMLAGLRSTQRGLVALAANSAQFRSGGPAFAGNAVQLYVDPADKFDALKDAIRSAQSHIHLEYYIFRGDGIGAEIRDLLVERANAGVEVRILVDGIGSLRTYRADFFDPLKQAGGQMAVFLPIRFARVLERVNFRNHRKIVVIDGQVGFVGGMNIGDEHLGKSRRIGKWHDSHVRICGPAVAELQRIFLTDWLFATNQTLADLRFFPEVKSVGPDEPAGGALVQIVSSGPDCRWPTIQQLFFQAITGAARQVLIASPYFVPDESLLAALETAALRGLDVRVLLPARSDQLIVTSAARSYYEELLEAGVRIFEYRDGFLHAKTLAVDGHYGSVGSANMDVRSFSLNFEVSAFIHSEAFAKELHRQFERDMRCSEEVQLETFRDRPRLRRFNESVAQLLSGIL